MDDGIDDSMGPPDTGVAVSPCIEPVDGGLFAFPWTWKDLIVGVAPVAFWVATPLWIVRESLSWFPGPVWIALQVGMMAWMIGYPLGVARRRYGRWPRMTVRSLLFELALALPIWIAILLTLVIVIVAAMLLGWSWDIPRVLQPVAESGNRPGTALFFVLVVLVGPIAEEVFFRGMLYAGLRRRMHPAVAAGLQAIAFGFGHSFGVSHALLATLGGLCLAIVYEWRRTLAAPIAIHVLQNAAAFVGAIVVAATTPVLGVTVETDTAGCRITMVFPESAAAEAGLEVGDVITMIDEYAPAEFADVVAIIRQKKVGDVIVIEYIRENERFVVSATLKSRRR